MPKITFTIDKNEYHPELVSKLCHVSSVDEVNKLEDEYGQNEVVDAIISIAEKEETYIESLTEETIIDFLWEEFYEQYLGHIEEAFVDSIKGE